MATCHALAVRGHDVTLVVRPDTALDVRDPFVFYDLPPTPKPARARDSSARRQRPARAGFFSVGPRPIRRHDNAVVYTRDLGLASFLLQLPKMRRPRLVYEAHGVADVVAEEMPRLLGNAELAPSRRETAPARAPRSARVDDGRRLRDHHARPGRRLRGPVRRPIADLRRPRRRARTRRQPSLVRARRHNAARRLRGTSLSMEGRRRVPARLAADAERSAA